MIAWIFIALFLIVVIVIAPRFKHSLQFYIVLFTVILVTALYFFWQRESSRDTSQMLIPASEIELTDLAFSFNRKFSGQITNNSTDYTLTELALEVVIEDCIENDCTFSSKGLMRIWKEVAPWQTVMFDQYLKLDKLEKPKGQYQWKVDIIYTKGR